MNPWGHEGKCYECESDGRIKVEEGAEALSH